MALTYTKGHMTGGTFTPTGATWFFENPYWNHDGYQDFTIKVQNTGDVTEVLKAFKFTFLIANSGGTTFYSSSGVPHTASGNGCEMTCTITHNNIDYILNPPMKAQTAVNELCRYFLGDDWYDTSGATHPEQVNTAIVCEIERRYKGAKLKRKVTYE